MCWVWQWPYLCLIPYIHRDINTAISARAHHHEKVFFCSSSAEKYINNKIKDRFSPFQEHHIFPTCIGNACASYRLESPDIICATRHRRTSMSSAGFSILFCWRRWELCKNGKFYTNSYLDLGNLFHHKNPSCTYQGRGRWALIDRCPIINRCAIFYSSRFVRID